MPTPQYQNTLNTRSITLDQGQSAALAHFMRLHEALIKPKTWRSRFQSQPKGIYCYGTVGRGKTLLMDIFFENLPRLDKTRIHFHAFMQQIHNQLHALVGSKDPLKIIAHDFAKHTKLLCLDEMMVDDVADAMILGRLLSALRAAGVVLVFTSNTAPDDLYKNGVQRQNFLPAIQMIKDNTEVVSIGSGADYRIRTLLDAGVFFTPLTLDNAARVTSEFIRLSNNNFEDDKVINIKGRDFISIKCADHLIWFSFNELCKKPRAYPDYLALAQQFKTIFITDMPICHAADDAAARRFVHLIDVLYDAKITLILSAAAEVDDLYQGQSLKKEFARTQSRLLEMRTLKYWNLAES